MAAWIACALCALVIVKPQEIVVELAGLPLLYVAFGAVVIAAMVDVLRRRVRLSLAPQVPFLAGFFAWAIAVTAVRRPDVVVEVAIGLAIVGGIFAAVAIGCATQAGLRALAMTMSCCAALVTWVAIAQSEGELGCFLAAPDDWEGRGELVFDGRACASVADCRAEAPVPDGNYRCERRGPLSTATIGGRVRYRGSLADPNELSLAISIALPFVAALAGRAERRARRVVRPVALPPALGDRWLAWAAASWRALPAIGMHAAAAAAVILSRSRSGLLAFLAVVGAQAVRRAGAWGVVVGCALLPPMLLLGGRSGTEAEESTDERREILREAFELIRASKGLGIGAGQFTDASSIGMTAHNAYVLAAAEAGIVGYLLFSFALYLSIKVPIVVWLGGKGGRFAPAIAIALGAAYLGIAFLSWTYKDVLFMVLGASAALWSAARAEDPALRVGLSLREAAIVALAAMGLLAAVFVGSRRAR